tara:strand:+ start:32 stop:466 length:435 start_codon:yes stop_codon:yes gene_type:complete
MKKLLVLLLLPLFSFGQIIEDYKYVKNSSQPLDGRTVTRTIDISEIQDEYIQIVLGNGGDDINPIPHLLSTSKYKNVIMGISSNSKKWNVYDGDELIRLSDEVDVLNYFSKYGFEFFKSTFTESYKFTKPQVKYTLILRNKSAK